MKGEQIYDETAFITLSVLYDVGYYTDLYGANNVEASRADMINDGAEDLRVAYTRMIYQNYVGISIQYKHLIWLWSFSFFI